MKITSLKARLLNIPRSATLTTSYGSWDQAPTILIELETDEGITGLGQASVDAPFYGETAVGMLANIRHHLAPVIVGADPMHHGAEPGDEGRTPPPLLFLFGC